MSSPLVPAAASTGTSIPAEVQILALAAVAIATVLLISALGRSRGRERRVRAIAAANGLRFAVGDVRDLARLKLLAFAGTVSVEVRNVLTRPGDDRVAVFEYVCRYPTPERSDPTLLDAIVPGGRSDELLFSAMGATPGGPLSVAPRNGLAARVPAFLPTLTCVPSTWVTRAFEAAGVDDIDLESEEFNRRFDVRCGDRRFAFLFLAPLMMEALLDLPAGMGLETFGNNVVVTGPLLEPEALPALFAAGERVANALSPLVADEYPDAAAIEARGSAQAWRDRPDGVGGRF
jgi:hypothetical protein